jgi:hypothetical protein
VKIYPKVVTGRLQTDEDLYTGQDGASTVRILLPGGRIVRIEDSYTRKQYSSEQGQYRTSRGLRYCRQNTAGERITKKNPEAIIQDREDKSLVSVEQDCVINNCSSAR